MSNDMRPDKSTLIGLCPADTLGCCADITEFVRQAVLQEKGGDTTMGESAALGLFWVMQAVESALRHEAERVQFDRKPESPGGVQ